MRLTIFANLSRHEVQDLLSRYETLMAPHMPFVSQRALPTTASSDMPSLPLRAVVTVAYSHDTTIQKMLVEELARHIISRLFTNAEKSLDILQALLVLCNWYNPHMFNPSSHTSLLYLCMALTTDLAIDRDPMSCEMAHMSAALESCGIPRPAKLVTEEEKRAVLAIFGVASTVFTSFRKTDVPSWTPWLQQCLETLAQMELESDKILISLVQSQKIMHQAMSPSPLHTPSALQISLDEANPADLHNAPSLTQTLLSLQHSCARIAIWEPSFLTHDLDGIWTCVSAMTSYLALYSSLPVPSYPTIPFTAFAQFAYIFVVMVHASSTHFDGFDGTLLRELVDFKKVMEQASEKYESVARLEIDGVGVRNKGFAEWAAKCRWAKTFYGIEAREMAERAMEGGGAHALCEVKIGDGFAGGGEWEGIEGCGLEF